MRLMKNEKEFHVVTSIGVYEGLDTEPIQKAFEQHLVNTKVTLVHVITESSIDAVVTALPLLENERVKIIQHQERPTFQSLFDYCNSLSEGRQIVTALMNGDVSFECKDDIEKCITILKETRNRGVLPVLTITRRDKEGDGFDLLLKDRIGLPNFLSSDCWVFEPPQILHDVDFFSMGQMNCDSILAYDWAESGKFLLNPCLDVSLLHQENCVKDDNFYREENKKETTQDLLSWHWAKRCNHPYRIYGVTWNCIDWIEKGYMPAPIQYLNKKIYLLADEEFFNDLNSMRVLLVEVIAKANGCDVVVLFEDVKNIDAKLIGQVAQVSRKVYFVEVDNIDQVVANLITGEQDYHESMALVRSLTYLTLQLLNEFHSVVLDQRGLKNVEKIELPNGHPNLIIITEERYKVKIKDSCVFLDEQKLLDSCGLITSLYKTDEFIAGFQDNITALDNYDSYVHVLLFSKLSELEQNVILDWHTTHSNLILCWYKEDPGLYECWNAGIRIAPTGFVSNANVDDLRHPRHLSTLVNILRMSPQIAVASTALVAFNTYISQLNKIDISSPWYTDQAGEFGLEELADLEHDENGEWNLIPHNLPHCMPIWRKSLHDTYGFFNEKRFGTFADWAFWLKVTRDGGKGYLDARPFAYYYVNLDSHNRRGDELDAFHQEVEREFLPAFYFRSKEGGKALSARPDVIIFNDQVSSAVVRKLSLRGLSQSFGEHRNSFNQLIEALLPLQREEDGIEFIPFLERYFAWGTDDGEAGSRTPKPIEKDWIGILHVPFDAPRWFEPKVSPEKIFKTDLWKSSFPHCRGLLCLSEDLRRDLAYWYPSLPSLTVKFPTELDVVRFDWKAYTARPRLVQAGDWLRRLQTIYEIQAPGHEKVMLLKPHTNEFLSREIAVLGDLRNDSVNILNMVSNEEYDELLSSSVAVVWLYATAANNIVIECIARCTPLIVNPLPSVVEYLGEDYPLYMNDLSEATTILADRERVRKGYGYLVENNFLRDRLTYEKFSETIAESEFYENL